MPAAEQAHAESDTRPRSHIHTSNHSAPSISHSILCMSFRRGGLLPLLPPCASGTSMAGAATLAHTKAQNLCKQTFSLALFLHPLLLSCLCLLLMNAAVFAVLPCLCVVTAPVWLVSCLSEAMYGKSVCVCVSVYECDGGRGGKRSAAAACLW